MTATLMDGKTVAARVRADVATRVAELAEQSAVRPGLATILVGDDPASHVYVASKRKACVASGMTDHHRHLPAETTQHDLEATIDEAADDPAVSGILVQLPLPPHLDSDAAIARIPAGKDVDGLTTVSAGLLSRGQIGLRPCTPAGVVELLDTYSIPLAGAHVVIVGRSALVGRPLGQLLLARDATVTICHSKTQRLAEHTRQADILIAAAGVRGLIGAEHVRPGATVIDVGIHRTPEGLCGDVDFDQVHRVAGHLTPVPGGVGPMTIAMLLSNTVTAAHATVSR
ncbi:bifunctional methylenetetrahydrofolate dehydrogenase/methenyltetrahydrofolate cyclohydrolase FolD [Rhodococcus pyridinivorans]|uniref:bifunctional methylenetetrahydrofolate dehydrogenase/methenyltetrahydrofolate cyclohydrolase FolD n=1 Tax=Rhodococcus pyridinivorans TaxID=103816 RepID=UPI002226F56D|nr:bifunctional methylenetetrahydrofolate dehydrogenase/methenyltetrahydrofolate cyclohydrolase FolD [Rhodococcus pyridinivorans]MCW3472017.1 bifunctional methylenetetrahydrofolate dehydrogenase/methenyltetrahydrofolate cyclohydrolase FolD [Rhodococcus pyridinivorans]